MKNYRRKKRQPQVALSMGPFKGKMGDKTANRIIDLFHRVVNYAGPALLLISVAYFVTAIKFW